jgi:hypothetical protein
MIKLYHYSHKDISDKIKVKHFGENAFTSYSQELCSLKRSYFYLLGSKKEFLFNGSKFKYIVNINKNSLYDLKKDKLNLKKRFCDCYFYLLIHLKKSGYKGIIGFNGFDVAQLFYDVKIAKKIKLY